MLVTFQCSLHRNFIPQSALCHVIERKNKLAKQYFVTKWHIGNGMFAEKQQVHLEVVVVNTALSCYVTFKLGFIIIARIHVVVRIPNLVFIIVMQQQLWRDK